MWIAGKLLSYLSLSFVSVYSASNVLLIPMCRITIPWQVVMFISMHHQGILKSCGGEDCFYDGRFYILPLTRFINIYSWASITRNLVDCAVLSFTTFMMTLGHCILNFHLQGVLYTDTNLSEWSGEVWQILSRVPQSSHSFLNSIHALIHMHFDFSFS